MSSDIDIAIPHDGDVGWELMSTLREALEESSVPYRVNLVDLTHADARLIDDVAKGRHLMVENPLLLLYIEICRHWELLP